MNLADTIKLRIARPQVEAMLAAFPQLARWEQQLHFGGQVEVGFGQLSVEQLAFLCELYRQGGPDLQARAAQLTTLLRTLRHAGPRFAAGELEMALPALLRFLSDGAICGWLFGAGVTGKALPYLVTRLDFILPSSDESGKLFIDLKANAKGAVTPLTLRIAESDIIGRTVGEMLAAKGFLKETPELIAAYDDGMLRYFDWRARCGAQFAARGTGFYAADPGATHRDSDWARKDVVLLASGEIDARLVNDEGVLANRALTLDASGDILGGYLSKAAKSNRYDAEDEVRRLCAALPKGLFTQMPVHPYMLMFHLDLHHHLWVHVDEMRPYRYQPELKDKLILPPEQTDLIDILTAEMDVLMDDIVAGKSGGTTVLCAGPPGVGKTLTAEVYSEIIQRPLYRVHSGQLGLSVASMETTLKDVLTRAQRWGAVVLIDEADVYIKRRDDNIAMNAVVGVFLRVLEYFNGLLFLTTNRIDDIDEAIVSRCIALIKFYPPDAAARRKIWQVMTAQFALDVAPPQIARLAELFPAASGRDIKGLSKLVAKFCHQKKLAPTLDVFERCSVFRGMDIGRPSPCSALPPAQD